MSNLSRKLKTALKLSALIACCILPAAGRANPLPLGKLPVPEPANLSQYVKDKNAAIRLGKAFFWDMQTGSDGVQACASCHFRAGADNRLTHQLNPGSNAGDAVFGNNSTLFNGVRVPGFPQFSADYGLLSSDFPFFQVNPVDGRLGIDPATGLPLDPSVLIVRDTNDVVGSQGIPLADFLAINAGSPLDLGAARPSPVYAGSRQVTARNAPSVINAVFNYTNFWDGRANNIFNGESPLGPSDVNAGIWVDDGSSPGLVKQKIAIPNASLASQATGPPLSGVEMSFAGRSFPELGRKMLGLAPLARQLVHPADSVLGPLAKATLQPDGSLSGVPGINASYPQMIRDAFQDFLWNSGKSVTLNSGPAETNPRFSQMEANFSLFWGLALQLYEATLVSDRTPFDRYLAGNRDSLSASAQNGFLTFIDKCAVCHSGSELTSAAVGSNLPACAPPDCNPPVFRNNSSHTLIRTDIDQVSFAARLADAGFFNIGVRPTGDDPGRGAGVANGFPFPLSFARLALTPNLPFVTPKLPAGTLPSTKLVVDGAFKAPGLRNVELTPPYFHNGGMATLDQVVEFYTRGGNFPGNPQLAGAMQPIRNLRDNTTKRGELVEFLKSLTDERVRNEWAPFDHPQLLIPSGDQADSLITLAATGGGPPAVPPGLTVNPVDGQTVSTSQTFSGTVAALSTVEVRVNTLPPLFATVTGSSWSLTVSGLPVGGNTVSFTATSLSGGSESQSLPLTVLPTASIVGVPLGGKTTSSSALLTIGGAGVASYQYSLDSAPFGADTPVSTPIALTGLADGTHTVSVLGRDAGGDQQPATLPTTASWAVKALPPLLTLTQPSSPTRSDSQTIGGSVELGAIPTVVVDTAALVGPVTTVAGSVSAQWSCTLTKLSPGANNITVTARDFVSNTSTVSGVITVVRPDGNFKASGVTDISDALTALRIAVGLVQPSAADLLHGDVAPLVNGVPAPDGRIDISDALLILRKAVGLVNF